MRVGAEPVLALFFSRDSEPVRLHYESDETVQSYLHCAGAGCCICQLGAAPTRFLLLSVYSLESRAVEVLRVSEARGPGKLRTELGILQEQEDLASTLVSIARGKNYRYTVQVRPLGEHADRGSAAIESFLRARKGGLRLSMAFLTMSPLEMAEVPRIRRKLDAIGIRLPSAGNSKTSADAADPGPDPSEVGEEDSDPEAPAEGH